MTMQDRKRFMKEYLELARLLRSSGIPTEVYLEPKRFRDQQLPVPEPSQTRSPSSASSGVPVGTVALPVTRFPTMRLPSGSGFTGKSAGHPGSPWSTKARQRLTTAIPANWLPCTSLRVTRVVSAPESKMPMPGGRTAMMSPGSAVFSRLLSCTRFPATTVRSCVSLILSGRMSTMIPSVLPVSSFPKTEQSRLFSTSSPSRLSSARFPAMTTRSL